MSRSGAAFIHPRTAAGRGCEDGRHLYQKQFTISNASDGNVEITDIDRKSGDTQIFLKEIQPELPSDVTEESNVTLQYSLVRNSYQPSQVIKLEGNIFDKNPNFIGEEVNNYHLLCNVLDEDNFSPCIDGGNPCTECCDGQINPNSGLWSTKNDMGAYGGPKNSNWMLPASIIDNANINMELTSLYRRK